MYNGKLVNQVVYSLGNLCKWMEIWHSGKGENTLLCVQVTLPFSIYGGPLISIIHGSWFSGLFSRSLLSSINSLLVKIFMVLPYHPRKCLSFLVSLGEHSILYWVFGNTWWQGILVIVKPAHLELSGVAVGFPHCCHVHRWLLLCC